MTRLVDPEKLARMGSAPPGAEERLRAVGALDGPGDEPAAFSFYVMIFRSVDVPMDATVLASSLAEGVVSRLRGVAWSSKLDCLSITPRLVNPSVGSYPDRAKHSRNGNVTIDISLDFARWMAAPRAEQRRLIAQCLAWGIRRIEPTHVSDTDRARMLQALQNVATRVLGKSFDDDGTAGPVTTAQPPDPWRQVLKLYRLTAQTKEYWERWREPTGDHVIHAGTLGTRGRTRRLDGTPESQAAITSEEARKRKLGYREIAAADHARLVVELPFGARQRKSLIAWRHRCEDLCNEVLGWTGLGHCDGGDSGGDSMTILCLVVDYPLAEAHLRKALEKAGYAPPAQIYDHTDY